MERSPVQHAAVHGAALRHLVRRDPEQFLAEIQQLTEGSGFNSPTDFVVYVLRDVISESGGDEKDQFSPEELQQLKQKLKNLGYL